jgi:putative nucleotidyltransferase with HDIG domain
MASGESYPAENIRPKASGDSNAAEQFLIAMVKVLRDRALYPAGHKQIHAGMANLCRAAQDLFLDKNKKTFVFIDGQVYVDDRILSGLESRQGNLAGLFHEKQIEALTIHEGVGEGEFLSFLELFASRSEEEGQKPVFHSPHLEVGYLSLGEIKKEGTPAPQGSSFAILKSSSEQRKFVDQTRRMQDIYTDWNRVQNALVPYVDRIIQNLEKSLFADFHSFIPLADLKSYDEYTYVHAINLSILTMAQAESLNFSKEMIHGFGIGALLHDVGKTKVATEILNKKSKLTPEEFEVMKTHPTHGAAILLTHKEIPPVAAIVAYEHHLKFDGTGYPSIKQKRTQHVAARLTSISDHFDAMRSNRPHQAAMEQDKIFAIMLQNKGSSLDPALTDHFIQLMKSRKISE